MVDQALQLVLFAHGQTHRTDTNFFNGRPIKVGFPVAYTRILGQGSGCAQGWTPGAGRAMAKGKLFTMPTVWAAGLRGNRPKSAQGTTLFMTWGCAERS